MNVSDEPPCNNVTCLNNGSCINMGEHDFQCNCNRWLVRQTMPGVSVQGKQHINPYSSILSNRISIFIAIIPKQSTDRMGVFKGDL